MFRAVIESPAAVLAVLTGIAAFYFWLQRATGSSSAMADSLAVLTGQPCRREAGS